MIACSFFVQNLLLQIQKFTLKRNFHFCPTRTSSVLKGKSEISPQILYRNFTFIQESNQNTSPLLQKDMSQTSAETDCNVLAICNLQAFPNFSKSDCNQSESNCGCLETSYFLSGTMCTRLRSESGCPEVTAIICNQSPRERNSMSFHNVNEPYI